MIDSGKARGACDNEEVREKQGSTPAGSRSSPRGWPARSLSGFRGRWGRSALPGRWSASSARRRPVGESARARDQRDRRFEWPRLSSPAGARSSSLLWTRRVPFSSGLGACTPAQIGLGTNDPPSCPQSSKVGTVEVETPLLENP